MTKPQNKPHSWGTSSTLLGRVLADEEGAWQALCDIYTPLVYAWARRFQLQEADAEDIAQEVFRRVAQGLRKFQYSGQNKTFRGWLWTITRHVAADFFSKQGVQVAVAEGGSHAHRRIHEAPDWINDDASEPPQLPASEEAALIRRSLDLVKADFSEQTWTAFWQFTIEGQKAADVAAGMSMSQAAVRQAKFRVLARIREVLG
ncbi:MAG: sigma-70 family RNA polymerase sigma factor [Planctomycetales bacterium]|nr:sigma-70 family RNA polymerase sigma factor [Planctomycetales bacterium]